MSNPSNGIHQVTKFEDISRGIVARFLQSAVVVDDRAYLHEVDRSHPHDNINVPKFASGQMISEPIVGSDTVDDPNNTLDAKTLIDEFADNGIVCSVISPAYGEEYESRVIKAAERADIIILDWRLQGLTTLGMDAATLVAQIISTEKSHERVRLIAIYTAGKLPSIREKIVQTLSQMKVEEDDNTLSVNATRICLFAKPGAIGVDSSRIIKERDLPQRLINEFTQITIGLLSNAALGGLAALRSNTHRILGKFPASLDAPYLSHRILNDPPEEAETHIVPLMVSELESVLDDSSVSDLVSIKTIESWLDRHLSDKPPLYRRMHIKSKASEADAKRVLLNLLKKGINADDSSHPFKEWNKLVQTIKKERDKRSPSKLTEVFTQDSKSGELLDRELALLMSTKSRYSSPPPLLTMGTIVSEKKRKNNQYYVCIQPRCDCLRLPAKGREFTFLPLDPVTDSSSILTHVIRDNDEIRELKLSLKLHHARKISLMPLKRGESIYALQSGENWFFKPVATKAKPLKWIAELKTEHAQRIANDFAREVSRVGLTESEWIRRRSKKE